MDARPPEMMRSTMQYWVQQCPECGYCAPDIEEKTAYADLVASAPYQQQLANSEFPKLANTFLALALLQETESDYTGAGQSSLRAAWAADDDQNASAAQSCRIQAIKHFHAVQENRREILGGGGATNLLVGDLLRRVGNFAEAIEEIDRGLTEVEDDNIRNLLNYEKSLCLNEDVEAHTTSEAPPLPPKPEDIPDFHMACPSCGREYEGGQWKCECGNALLADSEIAALREIEQTVGQPVPEVTEARCDIVGFVVHHGHVTQLGLAKVGLTTLPEAVCELRSLQILSLWDNQIATLPEAIGNLSSLKTLRLVNNQLTSLPDAIGSLKSCDFLEVEYNQLKTLPETIGNMAKLECLLITGNQLETLPESIGQLRKLRLLHCSQNRLTTLPEAVGTLQCLQDLMVEKNQLETLPEGIMQLPDLEAVEYEGNPMTTLPESLGQWIQKKKEDSDAFMTQLFGDWGT